MRTLLAFDTATETIASAVGRWPEPAEETSAIVVLGDLSLSAPRAANTRLLTSVSQLLRDASLDVRDLDAIVVGRGPGSFTGVRIAVATAKGLAQGLGVPLYGAGTLDAVAWRFADRGGLVGVVGDAMRQEVYPALFECGGGRVRRLGPDRVTTPEEAAERWAAETAGELLLTGDGLAKHAAVFRAALGDRVTLASAEDWTPTGTGLLQAAFESLAEAGPGDPGELLPVYTRLADAEEAEARRLGQRPRRDGSGVAGPEAAR